MNWTRTHTVIAGLALLALTNAVALLGAAWNRSGEEAKLRLTQRELQAPYRWYGSRENSGMSLELMWRVLREEPLYRGGYGAAGGAPAWLDQAKIEQLGFDTSVVSADPDRIRRRYEKQLPREVLLVLELEGPAYRRLLELAAQDVAREEALLASSPGDKNYRARVKRARELLERERNQNTRLLVVDAGLELAPLRAKYPDPSRYAIVRGQVRPSIADAKSMKFGGYVGELSIESINVPYAFRKVFGSAAKVGTFGQPDVAPFAATVVFGRRLEPWIVEAAKR